MVISGRKLWQNWGQMHCVISKLPVQRAISIFLINLLNTRDRRKKPYLLLLWTVVGDGVGYQAWQEFCCVWLELACHECLGQSGIWTSIDGELTIVLKLFSYYGHCDL